MPRAIAAPTFFVCLAASRANPNSDQRRRARRAQSESDVHLPDPSVSRNHALVDVQNGSLIVHDAGSTNGTYVNRERIDSAVLKAGDVVAFGKAELRVERS